MALLIRGGQVLNNISVDLDYADILIEGDRIVALGRNLDVPTGAKELDATGQFVLPGLVNAHTHAHNNLVKTLGDNWTLEDLRNHGTALYSSRTPEEQYVSAALGAIEMIKTGCTAAYDQFMVPMLTDEVVEAVVKAYVDVGLRAVLAPCLADIPFYSALPNLLDLLPKDLRRTMEKTIETTPVKSLLRLSENSIRKWNGTACGRIQIGVAPVIPGECSENLLIGCMNLVRDYGVSLHTHVAETKVQAIGGLRRWGQTIVSHLADIGILGRHFVGGHCVWVTEEDIQKLADAGAMVAHNPASNLKLGSGIAPVSEMLDRGVTVGLGTDGSMSSDNQNMFEAMRFAALVDKVRFPHNQDRWIGAHGIWDMATKGSAQVLGIAENIGVVAPGFKADLVLLRADSVFLRPLNNLINALVYAETGADVTNVLVDGRIVLDNGRIVTVNEDSLLNDAQKAADRLRLKNTASWTLAEQLSPYITMATRKIVSEFYPVNRYAAPITFK